MGELPDGQVGRMEQHRCLDRSSEVRCDTNVVVVRVRTQHGKDLSIPDHAYDIGDIVRGIDHHAFGVVANHPDVVVDVEGLSVQGERAGGDGVVDAGHQNFTTDRSTSPWCILVKAASMSPSPIVSDTNPPKSNRPCW